MKIFSGKVGPAFASLALSLCMAPDSQAQDLWNTNPMGVETHTLNGNVTIGPLLGAGARLRVTGQGGGPLAGLGGVHADIDPQGNARLELRGHSNPYIDFAGMGLPDYHSRILWDPSVFGLRFMGADVHVDQKLYVHGNALVVEGTNQYSSSPEILLREKGDLSHWSMAKKWPQGSNVPPNDGNNLLFFYYNNAAGNWRPTLEMHRNGNSQFHGNVGIGAQPLIDAGLYVKHNTTILEGDGNTFIGGAASPELLFKQTGTPDYWAIMKRSNVYGPQNIYGPNSGYDFGDNMVFGYKDVSTTPSYTETWRPGLELFKNGSAQFHKYVSIGTIPDNNLSTPSRNNLLHVYGKTLIGGNAPSATNYSNYLLAVDGLMVAKEIRVATTAASWAWPDYVFSSDYNLMPLEEVEKSVRANKHLPGIPSAKEVEEHGIDVGSMQAKLLQKVEELTLYMIELKKENSELRNELGNVKNLLNETR